MDYKVGDFIEFEIQYVFLDGLKVNTGEKIQGQVVGFVAGAYSMATSEPAFVVVMHGHKSYQVDPGTMFHYEDLLITSDQVIKSLQK